MQIIEESGDIVASIEGENVENRGILGDYLRFSLMLFSQSCSLSISIKIL